MEGGRSDEGELRSQGLTCFLTTPRSDPSTQTRYFQTHPNIFVCPREPAVHMSVCEHEIVSRSI